MNRQLKKMIKEFSELESKFHKMTVDNSTDEERKGAWDGIEIQRREIVYKCAELLGVRDEDDAYVIGSSINRIGIFNYLRRK